jgi:hypothetical protein
MGETAITALPVVALVLAALISIFELDLEHVFTVLMVMNG